MQSLSMYKQLAFSRPFSLDCFGFLKNARQSSRLPTSPRKHFLLSFRMDDPANQIRGIVRSLIEPYRHAVIGENVSKYFTPDALITNPFWSHARLSKSEIHVKSIYEIIRLFSINIRVHFQGVMFDETKEHCTIGRIILPITNNDCIERSYPMCLSSSRRWIQSYIIISLPTLEFRC
ncbi:hypothetical protein, variant [Puccinia triticina 1-1 BBBD Race 1]|uniref:SigF-like NTF2-like domain-containing protein n=1 Tax=Puccinia triticina (isolate 1-1 / race 1 (BBBD)) TaxID=630390 RepID=A0A180GW69_PUCT1|nr:hypothetical protein, variant [Puccinia triticina 1-1 BBBD Race 1]